MQYWRKGGYGVMKLDTLVTDFPDICSLRGQDEVSEMIETKVEVRKATTEPTLNA